MSKELLLERFQILEEVGSGGSAKVYKAFDTRMERVVAIKTIPVSAKNAPRTLREVQTSALLSHPNIVTLYEFDEDEENYYLIMEYVNGIPLSKILQRETPFTLDQSIAIASQICIALECAHLNDVIHRDIKPENIMLLRDGRVKVMDFGIARLKGTSTLTSEGTMVGTIGYMSPEQASGDYLDEATDIFSLGVVFYQMLTGTNPFEADAPAATIFKILNTEPRPPSEMNPSIPKKLDSVIAKALAKDPDERYRTITQMRYKIERQKSSNANPKAILRPLFEQAASGLDYLEDEDEFEGEERLENLRNTIWDVWENKGESIKRISGALLMAITSWYALDKLGFYSANLALFLPLILFLVALLLPLPGLILLPILITPPLFNFSPALTVLFVIFSAIYIATFGRRNPLIAIIPVVVPFMAKMNLAPLFPLFTGLFLSASNAALISGVGCLGLGLYIIFSSHLINPLSAIQGPCHLAANLKGSTNPFTALADILMTLLADQPLLLLQVFVWIVCGFTVGWIARNKRLVGDILGLSLGILLLTAGYVWLPALIGQPPLTIEETLRTLSFSFIILLLLLVFVPYKQMRAKHKKGLASEKAK